MAVMVTELVALMTNALATIESVRQHPSRSFVWRIYIMKVTRRPHGPSLIAPREPVRREDSGRFENKQSTPM